MLLATLLISIEIVGVETQSLSLLGISFNELRHPEYIKPILFAVFLFVLIGYMQRLYYEGWSIVKATYQELMDKSIDRICLKELIKIQRAEASRTNNENYYDTDMDDMLSMETYNRPTVRQLKVNPHRLEGVMLSLVGDSAIKQNKISVRAITYADIKELQLLNILVTAFLRPESYTHMFPLIYALIVAGYL